MRQGTGRPVSSSITRVCTQLRPPSATSTRTLEPRLGCATGEHLSPVDLSQGLLPVPDGYRADGEAAISTWAGLLFSFCGSPHPLRSSATNSSAGFSGSGYG